jgi:two-component sensor histidine kinase
MQLVNTLVDQLNGTVKLDRQDGTALEIALAVSLLDVRQALEP